MTAQESRDFDHYTIHDVKIPVSLLMENAGAAVAHAVVRARRRCEAPSIIVFVGPGNNGADAIVACRHLYAQGLHCQIMLLGDEAHCSAELRFQLQLLRHAIITRGDDESRWFITSMPSIVKDSIIIDGIFGAGLSRPPEGKALDAITFINQQRKHPRFRCVVVSVDIASGLHLEACAVDHPHVIADITVSFDHLKRAHISEPSKMFCGRSSSVRIGLFAKAPLKNFYRHQRRALLSLFKPLTPSAHKGHFGHVLVLEGDPQFLGASRLAARAALRVGAGLVSIATEQSLAPTSLDLPEFMHIKCNDVDEQFMKRIDAVVVGPGLGSDLQRQKAARDFVHAFCGQIKVLVLDADGLQLLSGDLVSSSTTIIATPHPKEAANLLQTSVIDIERDRFKAIALLHEHFKALNIIWVLKGATTLVRADAETIAFRGDLPLLAAGGSGDVLSGAIAGCIKQTSSPLAATLLAVSLQIEAAAYLSRRIKKGSFASELADIFVTLTRTRPVSDS